MQNAVTAAGEWKKYWYIPVAGAVGYATSVIHIYSFGPFIEPIQQEFGWTRAQLSMGVSLSALINAFFCVPIGVMVDKVGPRKVGLIGVILLCAAFATLGTATGEFSNWVMLWVLVAFCSLWVQATVWTSAVAGRFEKSRGLALAITLSGASFAAAFFPFIVTLLITNYDWRTAFTGMGLGWMLIVFPLLFIFFKGPKDALRNAADEPEVEAAPLTGVGLKEGFKSHVMYKLLLACALFTFCNIGAMVHFVPILTDRGAEPLAAAGIASLIGIFSIVGRLGTGFLLDRFHGHYVGAAVFLFPILACVLLLTNGSNPMAQAVAAACFGITVGSEVDVIAYLTSRHFGMKHFGALYGAMLMALSIGTAFGPVAAGHAYDLFGSYSEFLTLTLAMMAVASVSILSIGKAPEQLPSEAATV